MIVVDASVVVYALIDDTAVGDCARSRLAGEALAAPELLDLEVATVLRRAVLSERLGSRRAAEALGDLAELPVDRAAHLQLMPRVWELRDNVTAYDASYVALAEVRDVTLYTADRRLARAPGLRCPVEVLVA